MTDQQITDIVRNFLPYACTVVPDFCSPEDNAVRRLVTYVYADDPVRQGEFLKNLRATKEDMTTFDLLTLDARAWCVAFLKTEGKWKEA